jgi:hypothetical protein
MARPREADRSLVRDVVVRLMVRREQRKRWQVAADRHGMTLSAWLRYVADRAARTG